MISVVIFDLDGVLIDSQPLQYQSYKEVFSRYGHTLTPKDWIEWIHHGADHNTVIQRHGLAIDGEKLHDEKKVRYHELIDERLQLKPGARELIALLREHGFRLCVASASRMESIEHIMKKFHLRHEFEQLFSDRDLKFSKPHPQIFLEAARVMGVAPKECVVIEDSLAGLKAAKAASMKCIICPDPWMDEPVPEYLGADVMVKRLDEITVEMITL